MGWHWNWQRTKSTVFLLAGLLFFLPRFPWNEIVTLPFSTAHSISPFSEADFKIFWLYKINNGTHFRCVNYQCQLCLSPSPSLLSLLRWEAHHSFWKRIEKILCKTKDVFLLSLQRIIAQKWRSVSGLHAEHLHVKQRISRTIRDFSERSWERNFCKKTYSCMSFVQSAKKLLALSYPSQDMMHQKAWHSLNEGWYFVKVTDLMPTPICIPTPLTPRFCLSCLPGAGARPEHQTAHAGIH